MHKITWSDLPLGYSCYIKILYFAHRKAEVGVHLHSGNLVFGSLYLFRSNVGNFYFLVEINGYACVDVSLKNP
uniref:Uncharacterized protein n=1 Tax=Kalanchoe fedtschenkoi TaxID=63787 RepID=A0A7N0US52_KALFE